MDEEDASKTTFICPGFIDLFEWVVMTFGLKNAGATYQRAMNLIFHELLGNTVVGVLTLGVPGSTSKLSLRVLAQMGRRETGHKGGEQ